MRLDCLPGPNQTSPLSISRSPPPLHLLHHLPRCALLLPPSDHGKSNQEEEDKGHRRPGFDVFLSFHGHDVRHRIVDHLYAALLRKGIKPFKDDTEMERGLDVEEAISTAIQDSSIYLLLLSPGYASSAFCMDEAVEIMQRCCCGGGGGGGGGRVALPVFYLISPDDVCLPTAGCFKEHFLSHFDEFTYGRVQGWMDAFSSIGKISGWVHENGRSEALLVEEVSTTIQKLVLEMRGTRHDHFTKYSPPPPLSWMQLASSTGAHNDQHMELEYFEPQVISSTQGNDRIVRIPKPAYADHDSLHLCLVAQHYPRPGAGQLDLTMSSITTIATKARSLWKDENIQVETLDAAATITCTDNINGYIIRFLNEDTRNWVLESSPCLINGTQFFMRKWKGPSQPSSSLLTIPMWVRLYNVPEEYMNPKGLSYIASALGKPMYVDRATADCCYNHSSGSRGKTPAYAKVCVEISPKDQGIVTFRPAADRTMVIAIGDEKENLVIVNAVYQLEEDGQWD